MALQAIFHNAEKTRVFLQYDPARGYDLQENSRTARLWEIADQFQALGAGGGRGGRGAAAATVATATAVTAATAAAPAAPTATKAAPTVTQRRPPPPPQRGNDAGACSGLQRTFTGESAKTAGTRTAGVADVPQHPARTVCARYPRYRPGISDPAYLPARSGRPAEPVPPGFVTLLGGGRVPEPPIDATTSGGRTALANWIATKDNPLFARVMVNRIWHFHFGRGLIATPSDLGHRAGLPSHPELLDWLATEFVDNDGR